jgi:hypothetical protein
MKEARITIPEIALIAGTRAALGVGIGLLLASRLSSPERKAAGWTLLLVGAFTTIPLMVEIFGKPRALNLSWEMERDEHRSRGDSRTAERRLEEMTVR